jgi:hypothetical protein
VPFVAVAVAAAAALFEEDGRGLVRTRAMNDGIRRSPRSLTATGLCKTTTESEKERDREGAAGGVKRCRDGGKEKWRNSDFLFFSLVHPLLCFGKGKEESLHAVSVVLGGGLLLVGL